MDEKTKSEVKDILRSKEIRDYFQGMLKEQTSEIVSSIGEVKKSKEQEEISALRERLSQEIDQRDVLKQRVLGLETARSDLELLLEDRASEIKKLTENLNETEMKNAELLRKNDQLSALIVTEQERMEKVKTILEAEKQEISEKLERYERNFSLALSFYCKYCLLPNNIKQRISNIFVNENVYSMIVALSHWSSVDGLWGFTKRRIIEEDEEGVNELIDLFIEAFNLYSAIDGSGRYALINPSVGEKYDSDKHSIKGIKTDGVIKKVLLSGIYDSKSKKTVYKAVVQIL